MRQKYKNNCKYPYIILFLFKKISVQARSCHPYPLLQSSQPSPHFYFNIFNFPQHFKVLKHRLKVVKEKKSVSEFQHEYLEFKLQYFEFSIKIQLNYTCNPLKNTEKAGLPMESPAPLLQRYYIFRRKANSVKIRRQLSVRKRQSSPASAYNQAQKGFNPTLHKRPPATISQTPLKSSQGNTTIHTPPYLSLRSIHTTYPSKS